LQSRPRAVVVATGSELVRGAQLDANGPYLAGELLRLGAEPARILIVGDRAEELEAALREGLAADVCVTSGGLGPTHDDRTIELLARVAGRPLRLDPELERRIEAVSRGYAARVGRPYADFASGVRKQAMVPEGGAVLGLAGTAPGVLLEHEHGVAVALPGPPTELRRLWPRAIEHPALARTLGRARPRAHTALRLFGPSESSVARALEEAGGETAGLEITICARGFEIHVDLFAEEEAADEAAAVEAALRGRFGTEVFAEDDHRAVEEIVLDLARQHGVTLATAESCTGGLVGARLTAVAGASDVYVGGVIAYADAVKAEQLGVAEDVLARYGAVSAEAAEAMAKGARETLRADVAVAVTGVAGPGGATPEKPVGLVFLHVETPRGATARRLDVPGDREPIRLRATAHALHLLRHALVRIHDGSA
jgi:nicotinamide-nucleotide amidase